MSEVIGDPTLNSLFLAGTFQKAKRFKKKFSRRQCVCVDIVSSCALIDKYCQEDINLTTASGLLLGVTRIYSRKINLFVEDAKSLVDLYTRHIFRAFQLVPALIDRVTLSPHALNFNMSSEDFFGNISGFTPESGFVVRTALSHVSPLLSPLNDTIHSVDPRETTLPETPLPDNIDFENSFLMNESFGDGGAGFLDLDEPASLSLQEQESTESERNTSISSGEEMCEEVIDQSEDSIVPQDQLQYVSDDNFDLSIHSDILSFSLAETSTLSIKIVQQRRKKAPIKKFDTTLNLSENDDELLLDTYKTQLGPRAMPIVKRVPAPDLLNINKMLFLDNPKFVWPLQGANADDVFRASDNPHRHSQNSSVSSLSMSEVERHRLSQDNITEGSDQPSRSRMTASMKSSSSLQGTTRAGVVEVPEVHRALSPIEDMDEYESGGDMMDDQTPEQSGILVPSPDHSLNQSSTDIFGENMNEELRFRTFVKFTDVLSEGVVDRKVAASTFFTLLGAVSRPRHNLKLKQDKPYGEILIFKTT